MKCKVFKDNNGVIELAKPPNIRSRTKHITLKYHHFRKHGQKGLMKINLIDTHEQVADIFTKVLPFPIFKCLREKMMNWSKH